MKITYRVIGIMSGTSLDGLDIAYCEFEKTSNHWDYSIQVAETIPYSNEWKNRLATVETGSAFELAKTDSDLGFYIGKNVLDFIKKHNIKPQLIASHGHTIFHRPELGFSTQIGNGSAIYACTQIPTAFDFRSLDIALGGQGAPLVPIGDQLLFSHYDFCLNLGGIANISFKDQQTAFDISPCNMALNELAQLMGFAYDNKGELARQGNVCPTLFHQLNSLNFYQQMPPKSLGKEWYLEHFKPLIEASELSITDKLRSVTEHIAYQISTTVEKTGKGSLLITGGGALNTFLIERLEALSHHQIKIPHELTINYKEALIFAFLGVLRMRGENNCLQNVTGAKQSCCGGNIIGQISSTEI